MTKLVHRIHSIDRRARFCSSRMSTSRASEEGILTITRCLRPRRVSSSQRLTTQRAPPRSSEVEMVKQCNQEILQKLTTVKSNKFHKKCCSAMIECIAWFSGIRHYDLFLTQLLPLYTLLFHLIPFAQECALSSQSTPQVKLVGGLCHYHWNNISQSHFLLFDFEFQQVPPEQPLEPSPDVFYAIEPWAVRNVHDHGDLQTSCFCLDFLGEVDRAVVPKHANLAVRILTAKLLQEENRIIFVEELWLGNTEEPP